MNKKRDQQANVLLLIIVATIINSCTTGQSEPTSNLEEAKKAIAASNAVYFHSFVKNDSSIFINRYADDCCIMLPNAPAMCGRDGALKFYKMAYAMGLRNGKFITTEVYEAGKEFVAEVGLWQSFDAANRMSDDGKFLVLWKKTAKGWKMFRDSFSSNHAVNN